MPRGLIRKFRGFFSCFLICFTFFLFSPLLFYLWIQFCKENTISRNVSRNTHAFDMFLRVIN